MKLEVEIEDQIDARVEELVAGVDGKWLARTVGLSFADRLLAAMESDGKQGGSPS